MTDGKDFGSQNSLEELQQEHTANPFNMNVISRLAQEYANRGDYANACQLYEKLVRLDEDNGLAWIALGHCYLLKAEYQKCFNAYQKALYKLPNTRDPQLWYGIGLLYTKFETYEYAEPAFQAVLRIDPDFEQKNEVLYKLGHIYHKTGNLENAISYLRNCMIGENTPSSRKVEALCCLGSCFEKQGKTEEAVQMYKEALELNPTNFKTLEFLGWCLSDSDEEACLDYLKRALEHVGENSAEEGDLHYLLGRLYLKQQNFPESQNELQKAIFKNPNSYVYWTSIGILYAQAQQPNDAFECLVKASTLAQDRADVWRNMGALYEQCQQREEALLSYQRAFSYDPDNEVVARRKEELTKGEAVTPPPDFVHPKIEISEIPFSIHKEKPKDVKKLPEVEADGLPDLSEKQVEEKTQPTRPLVATARSAAPVKPSESRFPPTSQPMRPVSVAVRAPAVTSVKMARTPPVAQSVRGSEPRVPMTAPSQAVTSSPVFKVENKQSKAAPPTAQHTVVQPNPGPMQGLGFIPNMGPGYPSMGGIPGMGQMGMHMMGPGMQMNGMPYMAAMPPQMGNPPGLAPGQQPGMPMGMMGNFGMQPMMNPMQMYGAMNPMMYMYNPMMAAYMQSARMPQKPGLMTPAKDKPTDEDDENKKRPGDALPDSRTKRRNM